MSQKSIRQEIILELSIMSKQAKRIAAKMKEAGGETAEHGAELYNASQIMETWMPGIHTEMQEEK